MGDGERYLIMARWWNGEDFDVVEKRCRSKSDVIGAFSLLVREISPFQISYTDLGSLDNEPTLRVLEGVGDRCVKRLEEFV